MRKFAAIIFCLFLAVVQLSAQSRTVTGKVTDENGNPIANASVYVKGSKQGTSTNAEGLFTLRNVPASVRTVTISSLNYVAKDVQISAQNTVQASLSAAAADQLDEAVVVGYSTTTKEAFTGSAKVITGEKLNNKSVSNLSKALAGEVAGVNIINGSGQPGSSATVRIRGFGSVNGNRDPLYVVDGVPFSGNISSLNMNDVGSITVLKDAAATAIYGSRGANGVIVITTISGKGQKNFVEVTGKYGSNLALLPRYSTITSPEDYILLSWEAMYNEGVSLGNSNPVNYANTRLFSANGIDPRNNMWNVASGADLVDPTTKTIKPGVTRLFNPERWADYAFQPSNRTEAELKMGGSSGKTSYYTSFGYLNDVGYSINTNFKNLTGRLNLSHEIKPWLTSTTNVSFSNSISYSNGQGSSSNSVFWFVDNLPPIYPLFLRDASGNKVADPIFGGYQYDYGSTGRKFGSLTNAIADATYNQNFSKRNEVIGSTSLDLKFTKDLTLQNKLGVQYYNNDARFLNNKFYGSSASQNGAVGFTKTDLLNLDLLNLLRYAHRFGAHNIEVLAAHEANRFNQNVASASGQNLIDTYTPELANAIVINPTSTSYVNTRRLESYFAQANYDFQHTYYVSGTIRRDGSSKFREGKQWGTFGSLGLGWELTKMDFMKRIKPIEYLKLKASYGVIGDQSGVGDYAALTSISIGNLNNNPAFGVPVPANPDITWEETKMFQVGADFRIGSFLSGSIEYYVKNTDNLVFSRRVGPSNGYALITVNDGQLRNSGVDINLTGHVINKKDFFLDLGLIASHFNNKITRMPIDPSTGQPKVIDVQAPYGWGKGHSIFDYYMRNFAGVDPATGTSMWTVYYNDANNNKSYDAGEEVLDLESYYAANPGKKGTLLTGTTKNYAAATQYYIGKSSIPAVSGAFNLNTGFKNLTLDVQFLYSFGGYSYDGAYATLMGNGLIGSNNWSTDIFGRWQKAGDITNIPRISDNSDANVNAQSTRFLTKGNYLVLNNVRIGYTLPKSLTRKTGLFEEVSFFVSGDNLWLHTARKGFNPSTAEDGSSNMYRYSPLSTITTGLKVKF